MIQKWFLEWRQPEYLDARVTRNCHSTYNHTLIRILVCLLAFLGYSNEQKGSLFRFADFTSSTQHFKFSHPFSRHFHMLPGPKAPWRHCRAPSMRRSAPSSRSSRPGRGRPRRCWTRRRCSRSCVSRGRSWRTTCIMREIQGKPIEKPNGKWRKPYETHRKTGFPGSELKTLGRYPKMWKVLNFPSRFSF